MPDCRACTKQFEPIRTNGRPQVYCSPRCRDAGNYRVRVADGRRIGDVKRSNAKQNPPRCSIAIGTCSQCGALFTSKGSRPRRYCHADVCRLAFNAARARAGGWHRIASARRRLRMADALVERGVSLRYVIARDRGRCGICRRAVRAGARGGAAPSLDHVIPIALGGGHTRANVQLAHLVCNKRKNARPADDQLRMIG